MKKCLQKYKRSLAFLLAAMLVYGGVRNVNLTAAAENGSMDGQATVSGGDEGSDTILGEEPVSQAIDASTAGTDSLGAEAGAAVGMNSSGTEIGAAAGMDTPGTEIGTVGMDSLGTEAGAAAGADSLGADNLGTEAAAGMNSSGTETAAAAGMDGLGTEAAAIAGMDNLDTKAAAGVGSLNTEAGGAVFGVYVPDIEFPDNDELFAGYVEQLFYGGADSGVSLFGNVGGDSLTGNEKAVYDALKPVIQGIAAGTRTSTKDIAVEGLSNLADGDVRAVTGKALKYLLMDCPYDFYWYDKTVGMEMGYSISGDNIVSRLTISFAVAQEYRVTVGDANTINSSKVAAAKAASEKAQAIVDKHQGKSDYEKLAAYKQEICDLVAYNTDAASNNNTAYGNPWQLIWVFDDNSSTNVVCEGYSKAFQYLCDLSTFGNAACYTVTGNMAGATGAGPHMWNIVTIDGKNYLVDVTNCDTGTVGAPDRLFLAGAAGSVAGGYTFAFGGQNNVTYQYDSDATLLGGVLALDSENYQPKASLTITAPAGIHVTFGDNVSNDLLSTATAAENGVPVDGTFRWADSVAASGYGDAGAKKLAAVFEPDDTETYESAYSVAVSVTVDRKPVTITANDQTKTYGEKDPELTYTAAGTVAGCPLSGKLGREAGENAGSYAITRGTLTDANNPNYIISFTAKGSFVITKANYSGERTASVSARYGEAGVLDLASLLPEGYKLGTVTVADNDGILEGAPSLSGTQLSCRLAGDKAKIGKTAEITVPVTETLNYNGFDLTILVSMSDKLAQTDFAFQEAAVGKVYGDADFMAVVVNATPGSSLAFASSNPAVATVDDSGRVHILKVGSTVITVNASETADYIAASAVCTLTVAPKALTWDVGGLSAVDKEGTVQNRSASLYGELKVAGILEADRAEAAFNCPAALLTGVYADVAAGTQNVVLAWKNVENRAVLQGAKSENYTMPSTLPAIIGTITKVTGEVAPIPESTEALKFSITMENGISQVPEAFKDWADLNTPAKLKAWMEQKVQTVKNVQNQTVSIPKENMAVHDVSLMVSVNGGGWQPADKSNFPAGGLTVTLPYPAGTGRDSHDFVVCHLFTEDVNGHHAGETEYPAVTKTPEGISFKVYGLSPVSLGWKAAGTFGNSKVEDEDDDDDDEEEVVVRVPAAATGAISPKTGEQSPEAWPSAAALLPVGLVAYMWQKRRSRTDSGSENR